MRRRWRFSGTPWDRFRLQIPAEWEETEPDSQETVFQSYDFRFLNPGGSWAVAVLVGDLVFPSLAEYADELESMLLEDNPEILVRSTVQTPQGLRVVVLEVSVEDDEAGEAVVFGYLLGDGTAITVIYGFPLGLAGGGEGLGLPFLRHLPGQLTTRSPSAARGRAGWYDRWSGHRPAEQHVSGTRFLRPSGPTSRRH